MATKFTASEFQMVLESFDYIRDHLEITTDRLPDVLVKFWMIPDFFKNFEYQTEGVQLLVFMFVLRMNNYPEDKLDEVIKTFYFNWLFCSFQIILATINYCRNNRIPVSPFPLFDLQQYSLPDLEDGKQLLKFYNILTKQTIK